MMNTMLDDGVMSLMTARRELDKAHKAACAAMARFDAVKNADIMMADERIAARSLLDQTVPLCHAILSALQAVPDVALPKTYRMTEDAGRKTDGPCIRTAKSLLEGFRAKRPGSVVATSARYGKPLCAAIH
jgi:hypothetical protein